jgi:hypothetical protein
MTRARSHQQTYNGDLGAADFETGAFDCRAHHQPIASLPLFFRRSIDHDQ